VSTLEFQRSLPAKRMGAGLLLRDAQGRVLVVEPTYKPDWEIPGGAVDVDESPRQCVVREVGEELGIGATPGRLLVIDYQHPEPGRTESIMFVFDGGVVATAWTDQIELAADELHRWRLVALDELSTRTGDAAAPGKVSEVTDEWTTWDGLPISRAAPYGAMVVVYRTVDHDDEFLALHRAEHGPSYEGDWAWTPPSGARLPGEPVERCAQRELAEETGLDLPVSRAPTSSETWAVFVAEAPAAARIVLDAEHDRFAWLTANDLLARCAPEQVADQIRHAITLVATSFGPHRTSP
jgi:8-oxo-dGTP diphosphatase